MQARRERTQHILRSLCLKNIEEMNLTANKLAYYFANEWGLKVETVKSYIDVLSVMGLVRFERVEGKRVIRIAEHVRERFAKEEKATAKTTEDMLRIIKEFDKEEEEKTAKTERSKS